MKNFKELLPFLGLVLVLMIMGGCAAGPNPQINTVVPGGEIAGFWLGLWQGFIMPYLFIGSLFVPTVGIYEVHNSGSLYNLGFLIGSFLTMQSGTTVIHRTYIIVRA